jgi:hypothetical protein
METEGGTRRESLLRRQGESLVRSKLCVCHNIPVLNIFIFSFLSDLFLTPLIHSQALIVQDGPLASLSGFLDHTHKDTWFLNTILIYILHALFVKMSAPDSKIN